MKNHIQRHDTYSLATLPQISARTVTAYISIEIHNQWNNDQEALHLTYADALLSGTKQHTRAEFLNAVNLLGASIDVRVQGGVLSITLKSTAETFAKLLKLTTQMLTEPAITNKEVGRVIATTINDLHAAKEDSKQIAHSELQNQLYGQHDRRYSHSIDNLITTTSSVTSAKLRKLHTTSLQQEWICSITGNSQQIAGFEKMIQHVKKKYPKGKQLVGSHQQKTPKSTLLLTHVPSRHNIDLSIGAPIPITLHHPDYIPLTFAIAVLGKWGGFTGRLMSTVREKEGLTYGIYARPESFTGTEQGYWRIMTFFAPDKVLEGLTSTFREISNLHAHGITQKELDTFKVILGTQQTLLQDSAVSQLAQLHAYHCQHFTLSEIEERKARINSLTLQEVNDVISAYLDPTTLTVSGAGPVRDVKKDLQAFMQSVS